MQGLSQNLPGREKPKELGLLKVPGAVPMTDRYYPSGLLGYGFFGRGLTAESLLGPERVKILVMLFPTREAALKGLDEYGKYLKIEDRRGERGREGRKDYATSTILCIRAWRSSLREICRRRCGLKDPAAGDALVTALRGRLPEKGTT